MSIDYIPLIIMWIVMALFMAAMGYDIFDRPAKTRRLFAYRHGEVELTESDKRERKEGAWIFILSPLAPLVLACLVVFGIGCGLYFIGKFFFTVFPEMIRALR